MVHRREIDGAVVAFGHQGAIWEDAQAIFDHQSGSVWSQPYGAAFMGELAGYELELVPFTMTTWSQWKELYPQTLAYADDIAAQEESLDASAIVVESFGEVVAYPLADLADVGVVNDVIGTERDLDIAIVLSDADSLAWRVYVRSGPDGGELVMTSSDDPGEIVDTVSGSTFHAFYGYGIDGPLADHQLQALPVSTIFTEQFPDYHPNGRIWTPEA